MVITGASQGLGKAIASLLAERKAKQVHLWARRIEQLEQVKDELNHENVLTASVDVTDYDRVVAASKSIPVPDIVFCCAGTLDHANPQ